MPDLSVLPPPSAPDCIAVSIHRLAAQGVPYEDAVAIALTHALTP